MDWVWAELSKREVTCVWCGFQESTLQSQAEHLYEHAKTCSKHPVRKAEQERDRMTAALRLAEETIMYLDLKNDDQQAMPDDSHKPKVAAALAAIREVRG